MKILESAMDAARTQEDNLSSPFPERSIRTVDDWRRFVSKPTAVKLDLPSAETFFSMTKVQRKRLNEQRIAYNNSFGPVLVPAMEQIHRAGLRLAEQNLRAQPGARPGLIINGDSTIGKSTIAMQLGRRYELKLTQNHKITTTPTGHNFYPVAYINLPATMAILNFNILLSTFYHIPVSKRQREEEMTSAIKAAAADCGTSMFILDDIHFLQIRNRTHATLNNHIKSLANSISATFVYAGIDLENTGLLTEGKSAEKGNNTQTGHRFKIFDMHAFSMKTTKASQNYEDLLNYFEEEMSLYKQSPGSLFKDFGPYILDRTGGFIGPISLLLRECSTLAINNGNEAFTFEDLHRIKLDHDSEKAYRLTAKRNYLGRNVEG
jgi:hypothetical protein